MFCSISSLVDMTTESATINTYVQHIWCNRINSQTRRVPDVWPLAVVDPRTSAIGGLPDTSAAAGTTNQRVQRRRCRWIDNQRHHGATYQSVVNCGPRPATIRGFENAVRGPRVDC